MPSLPTDSPIAAASPSAKSSVDGTSRKSHEKTLSGVFTFTNGSSPDPSPPEHKADSFKPFKNNNLYPLPNGLSNGNSKYGREEGQSKEGGSLPINGASPRYSEGGRISPGPSDEIEKPGMVESAEQSQANGEHVAATNLDETDEMISPTTFTDSPERIPTEDYPTLQIPNSTLPLNRFSTPPGMSPTLPTNSQFSNSRKASSEAPRLIHRHTLQVPKSSTLRSSRDFSFTGGPSEEALSTTGRFSPTHNEGLHRRRASLGMIRRTTRSMHSDPHAEEVHPDEDVERWTEAIRQKRASKRKRKEEEDDDRVIVGTKVDHSHVNWVTAYNMLTGIRFTVSRTNAKIDRELTDADFTARHKFSFDVTGTELTPSAKYDFKFKDYSPWVFRHLRSIFGLDPADYLMSLTSKYILSELGSPGKSGSFFYFSRDYKYIIKTIHHAEHKVLRKILRQYYKHVLENPNTLISQFYGLHRVKIPYGRKIHFVVMNNLFPPHRDIHQMFDLKGSTVGRDFKEEDLEKNPRATMKDLNWLRRDLHIQFDHHMKELFIKQMQRDVALLQRLHIMDYSLLVGLHDIGKGNEENLREATLQIFQPGGEREQDDLGSTVLIRTPSRLEVARKARELRLTLKKEKPVPMGKTKLKMPDELINDERKDRLFYSADGGVRATHEDGSLADEIYYLGIIDCLTHYGFIKRVEHLWKGFYSDTSQISPIPPEAYGNRFTNFITGITMTKEEAERKSRNEGRPTTSTNRTEQFHSLDATRSSRDSAERMPRSPVDRTMQKAHKQAEKSEKRHSPEDDPPDRTLGTIATPPPTNRSNSNLGSTLPMVEEVGEGSSSGGKNGDNGKSTQGKEEGVQLSEKSNPEFRRSHGGIRRVLQERDDGQFYSNDLSDIPDLPPLSASPPPMDPEKSIMGIARTTSSSVHDDQRGG